MATLIDLRTTYLDALKRVTEAYDTLHQLMGPAGPLTSTTPYLTKEQITAQEEAVTAQKDYEAARDAYWAEQPS